MICGGRRGEDNDSIDMSGLAKLNRIEWLQRDGGESESDRERERGR